MGSCIMANMDGEKGDAEPEKVSFADSPLGVQFVRQWTFCLTFSSFSWNSKPEYSDFV